MISRPWPSGRKQASSDTALLHGIVVGTFQTLLYRHPPPGWAAKAGIAGHRRAIALGIRGHTGRRLSPF